MRSLFSIALLSLLALPVAGADPKADPQYVERRLYEVLREVHNQGADLYDMGDRGGSYRMFQGALLTARALLAHRPQDQKFIDEGLAAADKLSTTALKAFALHEVIDNLRKRIKPKPPDAPELLVPPRVRTSATIEEQAKDEFRPPLDGMGGLVLWQGEPVAGVELMFISRGRPEPLAYEARTDDQGRYTIAKMRPGKYTVLLELIANRNSRLPEQYRSTQTSPLVIDVSGKGEVIDLVLR